MRKDFHELRLKELYDGLNKDIDYYNCNDGVAYDGKGNNNIIKSNKNKSLTLLHVKLFFINIIVFYKSINVYFSIS